MTVWNGEAFGLTTLVPVVIMLVVNYGVLRHKLKLSPLKIPAQGSVGKKAEEGNLSESEDENLFQIPASGDFSEYE